MKISTVYRTVPKISSLFISGHFLDITVKIAQVKNGPADLKVFNSMSGIRLSRSCTAVAEHAKRITITKAAIIPFTVSKRPVLSPSFCFSTRYVFSSAIFLLASFVLSPEMRIFLINKGICCILRRRPIWYFYLIQTFLYGYLKHLYIR